MKHPNTFKLTYKTKGGVFCAVLVNTNAPTETAQDGATVCKWAEERARAYCADKGAEFVALAEPAESVQSLTARGMSCLIWDYTPEAETTEETTAGETEAREAFPHLSAAVENLIQKRAEIIEKAQELAKLCDDYNAHTVGNLPRLVNYSRYWSADVLREENR